MFPSQNHATSPHDRLAPGISLGQLFVVTAAALTTTILLAYLAGHRPGLLAANAGSWQPLYLLGMVAAIFGLITIVSRPELGLYALVVVIYTNASELAVTRYGIPSPLQGLTLLTGFAALMRGFIGGPGVRRQLVLDPLVLLLVAYGVAMLISSLRSANLSLSDEILADHLKGILVCLLLINLVNTRLELRRVIWLMILSGTFLALISVIQVFTGSFDNHFGGFANVKVAEVVAESRDPRIAGPLSDPNFYGQILVALVPLAAYRLWDEKTFWAKIVAGLCLAFIALSALLTFSRGAAIAMALVFALALIHRRTKPKYIVIAFCVLAPLLLLLPHKVTDRLTTLTELVQVDRSEGGLQDSSFRDRKRLMTVAWQMFNDHPLIGVGPGNYSENFDTYADHIGTTVNSYERFGTRRFPHNLYLQIAAETGVLGLLSFLAILVGTFATLASAYRRFAREGERIAADIVASIALAIAAYLMTSLFLHGSYLRYFWLLIGVAAAAGQIARSGGSDRRLVR